MSNNHTIKKNLTELLRQDLPSITPFPPKLMEQDSVKSHPATAFTKSELEEGWKHFTLNSK